MNIEQQFQNYPMQITKVVLQSYIGGCAFGIIIFVLSKAFAGPQSFGPSADFSKINLPKHKNFGELYSAFKRVK